MGGGGRWSRQAALERQGLSCWTYRSSLRTTLSLARPAHSLHKLLQDSGATLVLSPTPFNTQCLESSLQLPPWTLNPLPHWSLITCSSPHPHPTPQAMSGVSRRNTPWSFLQVQWQGSSWGSCRCQQDCLASTQLLLFLATGLPGPPVAPRGHVTHGGPGFPPWVFRLRTQSTSEPFCPGDLDGAQRCQA